MESVLFQESNLFIIQTIALILTAGSAFAAFLAAFFNFRAIKTHLDNEKSKVLLQCLEKYFNVRKDRTRAIQLRRKDLCEDYYREILDLLWTEFILWRNGYIDDEIINQWSMARVRCYSNESLEYDENEAVKKLSCKEYWEYVTSKINYFELTDPFVSFMNHIQTNDINEAIKTYSPYKPSLLSKIFRRKT
nr:hypothetical protein [uncultured Methanoregula sp.]